MRNVSENTPTKVIKYKWKVQKDDCNRFVPRPWPDVELDGNTIAHIRCSNSYSINKAKTGNHSPLSLYVAIENYKENSTWCWRKIKGEFKTIKEAKNGFASFVKNNPNIFDFHTKKD